MPIRDDSINVDIRDYPLGDQEGARYASYTMLSLERLKPFLPADLQDIEHAIDLPWHIPLAPGNPWGTNVHQLGVTFLNIRPPDSISFTLTSPDGTRSVDFLHLREASAGQGVLHIWQELTDLFPGYTSIGQYQGLPSFWDIPAGTVIDRSSAPPGDLFGEEAVAVDGPPRESRYVGAGGRVNWDAVFADLYGKVTHVYRRHTGNNLVVDAHGVPYSNLNPPPQEMPSYYQAETLFDLYYGTPSYPHWISELFEDMRVDLQAPHWPMSSARGGPPWIGSWRGWTIKVHPRSGEPGYSFNAGGYLQVPAFYLDIHKGFFSGVGGMIVIMVAGAAVAYFAGPAIMAAMGEAFGAGATAVGTVGLEAGTVVGGSGSLLAIEGTSLAVSSTLGESLALGTAASTFGTTATTGLTGTVLGGTVELGTAGLAATFAEGAAILATPTLVATTSPLVAISANTLTGALTSTVTQGMTGHIDPLGILVGGISGGAGAGAGFLSLELPTYGWDLGLSTGPVDLTAVAVRSGTSSAVSAVGQAIIGGEVDPSRVASAGITSLVGSLLGRTVTGALTEGGTEVGVSESAIQGGERMMEEDYYSYGNDGMVLADLPVPVESGWDEAAYWTSMESQDNSYGLQVMADANAASDLGANPQVLWAMDDLIPLTAANDLTFGQSVVMASIGDGVAVAPEAASSFDWNKALGGVVQTGGATLTRWLFGSPTPTPGVPRTAVPMRTSGAAAAPVMTLGGVQITALMLLVGGTVGYLALRK